MTTDDVCRCPSGHLAMTLTKGRAPLLAAATRIAPQARRARYGLCGAASGVCPFEHT